MNKWLAIVAAAFPLTGCGLDVGWVPGVGPQSVERTIPPSEVVSAEPDPYCRAIAHQRKLDGKAYGYDRDTLNAIEQGAYNDCEAWRNPQTPK